MRGGAEGVDARLSGIDRNEALRYMGYRGSIAPDALCADLERCERLLLQGKHQFEHHENPYSKNHDDLVVLLCLCQWLRAGESV